MPQWGESSSIDADDPTGGTSRVIHEPHAPKKGVIELVEAWHRLGRVSDGWVCELVYTLNGPEEVEYEAKIRG